MPKFERFITVTIKVEGEWPDLKSAIRELRVGDLEEEVVRVHGDEQIYVQTPDDQWTDIHDAYDEEEIEAAENAYLEED